MKLLIITQKVDRDDAVLGFFHRWLEEFAKHCEKVTVICLGQGNYDLPNNVKVLSLGKEKDVSRLKYIFNFYKYLWQERQNYDTVFVHMNPIYVVLAGWYWRFTDRKISLWYTHRQVDLKLRVAEKFTHLIFSAAPESFRLVSKKLRIVGHGIDVEAFACPNKSVDRQRLSVVHVGRITRIKNCDILIEAVRLLREKNPGEIKVVFIGEPVTAEDHIYKKELLLQIERAGLSRAVEFIGSLAHRAMPAQYCQADITVNLTPTGGIDKSVLESMAAGVPVLTSNQAFGSYFGRYADRLLFSQKNASVLAEKMAKLIASDDLQNLSNDLQQIVAEKSEVKELIKKIINQMQ